MEYRALGNTGIRVSAVAFGCGPVAQLLAGESNQRQRSTIEKALELGINWFDTAATYNDGQSEEHLGRVLEELDPGRRAHVATKVRILPHQLGELTRHARESVVNSLRRLRLERVALVQIHNSITRVAGTEPTSITPAHVLGVGGLLEQLERLRQEGLVEHLGLTGLGEPGALKEVIASGRFATLQIPYHLLNPSAGQSVADTFAETNHCNLIVDCARRGMGVFAIRVLAGGALAGHPPSPHTLKTPFFPLALYERDRARAERLTSLLPAGMSREEAAIRFALSHANVSSAIVGFGDPQQVAQVAGFAAAGPLEASLLSTLGEWARSTESASL